LRRRSITIGILTDDLADAAMARFVAGAQSELGAGGHAAVLVSVHPDVDSANSLHKLLAHRVDGVLVIAPSLEADRTFSGALRDELPLVSLNHLPGTSAVLLGSSHRKTGELAGEHLAGLGHRVIGTVTGPPSREVVRTRLRGFRTALAAAGIDLPQGNVEVADWTADGGYLAAGRLLDRNPAITALFVQSDTMAVGVLRLLADRGVRVPEQMSVIGCDDLPLSRLLVPSLTTVAVPFVETGSRAAAVLLDLIAGRDVPRRQLLPVTLVSRASTGPPPVRRARGPSRARAPAGRVASGTPRHTRNLSANPAPSPARRTSSDDRTA
jgi:LacI family transcriptional regulator